jgi:hypothetical protein
MTTVAGTPTMLGTALDSETSQPLAGAAEANITVPVEPEPPGTLDGITDQVSMMSLAIVKGALTAELPSVV